MSGRAHAPPSVYRLRPISSRHCGVKPPLQVTEIQQGKRLNKMTSETAGKHKSRSIIDFLRRHWKALVLALLAVLGEAGADVLNRGP